MTRAGRSARGIEQTVGAERVSSPPPEGSLAAGSLDRGCRRVAYARMVRLAVEIAAARGVAALSRLVGAGAGMTVPGKLLSKLDPGAIDLPAARTSRSEG